MPVGGKAFFTMFILLVCLVLMVQNYPADLVMLGGTIIFFITGVLPGEKGELWPPLGLRRDGGVGGWQFGNGGRGGGKTWGSTCRCHVLSAWRSRLEWVSRSTVGLQHDLSPLW